MGIPTAWRGRTLLIVLASATITGCGSGAGNVKAPPSSVHATTTPAESAAERAQVAVDSMNAITPLQEATSTCVNAIVANYKDQTRDGAIDTALETLLGHEAKDAVGVAEIANNTAENTITIQYELKNNQVDNATFDVGRVIFALIGNIPGFQLFSMIGDPAIYCTEAAFWLTGQLGGQLGQLLRAKLRPLATAATANTVYSGYTTPFAPTYYAAGANWSVPHANCAASPSSSGASQWVGLGGVSGPHTPSAPLVQDGVESHCVLGRQINQPFWKIVPADTASNLLSGRTVNAGDQMVASIEYLGGKYYLSLGDYTQKWFWSTHLSTGSDSLPTTADWIVQAGTIDIPRFGQIVALADFGKVTFQAVSYTSHITGCVLQCGVLLGSPGHDRTVPYEVVIGRRQATSVSQASPTGQFTVTYSP